MSAPPATSKHARHRPELAATAWDALLAAASMIPEAAGYELARVVGRIEHGIRGRAVPMRPEVEALAASSREVEQWRRRACELKAYEEVDFRRSARSHPPSCVRVMTVRGREHLDRALAAGRGAILYSVHVRGNYMFVGALAELGYPINIIRLEPPEDDREARRHWRHMARRTGLLEELGCRLLGIGPDQFGAAVKAANALRRNEVVVTHVDVLHSRQAVDVRVVGTPSRLISGHATLARVTGAPLLGFYVSREGDWRSQVGDIGPPLYVLDGGLEAAVQESATLLEPLIRRNPAQWYG